MKTKGILIALTVAIFTSLNLFANATTTSGENYSDTLKHRMNIRVNKNQVVLRADCMKDQKRLNFVLSVYSENGNVVYLESFHRKNGVYQGFDMSKLPDGQYTFVISQNLKKIYSKEIVKSSELVSLEDGTKKMIVQIL